MSDAIRLLTEADMPALLRLCGRDPVRYLAPRMHLCHYGLAGSLLRSWGVFHAEGEEMRGVMFRLNNTAILADNDGSCAPHFASVLDKETGIAGIRGAKELLHTLQSLLRRYKPDDWEDSFFMQLRRPPYCPPQVAACARRASLEDLEKLSFLYSGAGTMYRSRSNVERKLKTTRVFVVEVPETHRRPAKIVSCALLNVEGENGGLIGGVYTQPEARGKGYAAACTTALCLDLQRDGKIPFLFYENLVAGRVYRRLGFEEIDRWAVLYVTSKKEAR